MLSPPSRSLLTSLRRKEINTSNQHQGIRRNKQHEKAHSNLCSPERGHHSDRCIVRRFRWQRGGDTGVHMGETTFLQSSVTISKGSSLNLIDDVPVLHSIGNGSWVNNVIKPAREPGAPVVTNLQFNAAGQSMAVGPFNTAGTFHLYCSVHLNMNLTVIVQ
jgi:plastocyanin